MYRRLSALLFLWLTAAGSLRACDACGCSLLLGNWSPISGLQSTYAGLRWQRQAYRSYATAADREAGMVGSREFFQMAELRAGWAIAPRWQVAVGLPYALLQRETAGLRLSDSGLGDVSLMVTALLWQSKAGGSRLTGAVALEAPTGVFAATDNSATGNASFQLGSGSWDAALATQLLHTFPRWSLSLDASYRINGVNPEAYRYGNRLMINGRGYYRYTHGNHSWSPFAGLSWESAGRDVQRGFYRNHTGGYFAFAQLGLQWSGPKVAVEVGGQLPVAHRWADGLVIPLGRVSVQGVYFF
jgi:hypothetical protein